MQAISVRAPVVARPARAAGPQRVARRSVVAFSAPKKEDIQAAIKVRWGGPGVRTLRDRWQAVRLGFPSHQRARHPPCHVLHGATGVLGTRQRLQVAARARRAAARRRQLRVRALPKPRAGTH